LVTTSKERLSKRLTSYWKMEVGNALLMPAFLVFICHSLDQSVSWWLAIACVPMCALLVIGGLYWRAKLHQLEGQPGTLKALLPIISKWQMPLAVLSAIALAVCALVWLTGLGASTGDRVAITVAAVLAALEYINYYHRQLQHFDHWADFKRLISGQGFAPAQMASDVARWRRSQAA
jgi:hypothetical protein